MTITNVKYIINLCSSINHQNNPFFDNYPQAKMDNTFKPSTGSFHIVDNTPIIINAFAQLFPGSSKQHNDTPSLRLKWFESILNNLLNRFNTDISSIAFPPGLNQQYLLKIENFAKKIYLTARTSDGKNRAPVILDYNGKTLIDLEQQQLPVKYFPQKELVLKSIINKFPYNITKSVNFEELKQLIIEANANSNVNVKSIIKSSKLETTDTIIENDIINQTDKEQQNINKSKPIISKPVDDDIILDMPTPMPTPTPTPKSENEQTKRVVRRVRILKNKYIDLFKSIHSSWQQLFIGQETLLKQLKIINDTLVHQINDEKAEVFPCPYDLTFNCFNLCHLDKLKVVILGQDPYHANKNEAMGLAFSVPTGTTVPPSLKNIFKELSNDIPNFTVPENGDLTGWSKQGVLLLNTSLTVIQKNPGSHMSLWKPFTSQIIQLIANNTKNLVFILWGQHAKAYISLIPKEYHLILEASHPSPMSANNGGFFGTRHFSKTNQYLEQHNKLAINWQL